MEQVTTQNVALLGSGESPNRRTYILDTRGCEPSAFLQELSAVACLQTIAPSFSVVVVADSDVFPICRMAGWPVEFVMPSGAAALSLGPKVAAHHVSMREEQVTQAYSNAEWVTVGGQMRAVDYVARNENVARETVKSYLSERFPAAKQPSTSRAESSAGVQSNLELAESFVPACYLVTEIGSSGDFEGKMSAISMCRSDPEIETSTLIYDPQYAPRIADELRGNLIARNPFAFRVHVIDSALSVSTFGAKAVFDVEAFITDDLRFSVDGREYGDIGIMLDGEAKRVLVGTP